MTSLKKELAAIDALDAPHDLVHVLRALVTGVDPTNHPKAKGEPNRRRAFTYLREDELLRNGKRTKGGVAAVPILRAVTALRKQPAKPWARMLLVDLLASDHLLCLTNGVDLSDPKIRRRYARGSGRTVLDALVEDADRVLKELDDPEPSTRSTAAFLLGFLSPVSDRSLTRLVERGAREEDPWVKASLMMAAALVARYRDTALDTADLEAWCGDTEPVPRALAWVAALYSDPTGRALSAEELTGARAEALVQLLASGDPSPTFFPWACGQPERVIAWQLAERGEAAALFAAEVLARASREEMPGSSRYALEALQLCFEVRYPGPAVDADSLDESRRRVVSLLSSRHYGNVAFARFGLPASPADRRRWLGETPPTALERVIAVGGREVPLGDWLRERHIEMRQRKLAWRDIQEAHLAALRAHLAGEDLLQALCYLACGASNLSGRPITSDHVRAALAETGPSAAWIRPTLEALAEDRGNLRGSGVGMALVAALARLLPEGEVLPGVYDDLLKLRPVGDATVVMHRLPQARRDAIAVRVLEHDARVPIGGVHVNVEALLELADLVTPSAVAELAIEIADQVVADSNLALSDPAAAQTLRARVRDRFAER